MSRERIEVQRTIPADPSAIFQLLCDPQGHVAIDSSGMRMDATGEPVAAVGDKFVVHMDREALNELSMGCYGPPAWACAVTRNSASSPPGIL